MQKSIIEKYAAAVCFIAVVCGVISLGTTLYSAVGIADPEFTMNSTSFSKHQSNDAFWQPEQNMVFSPDRTTAKFPDRPNEAELTRLRKASFEQAVAMELRASKQTFIKWAIVVMIDLALFLFHWRILIRAKETAA